MKTSDKALGVMIVGAGNVAGEYLDYFNRTTHAKLVAIADIDSEALRDAADKYKPDFAVTDYKKVLSQSSIDLVVICTPHHLHHPIVMDALRAGKDVLCEKPIAISVAQADEMLDTAQSCGRELFVMLNMRFDKVNRKIKEILSNWIIGHVFMAHTAYLGYEVKRISDPADWKSDMDKAGGGALIDAGYHAIDLINYWLTQDGYVWPKYVQALGGRIVTHIPHKGEDNIALLLEYTDKTIINIQVSFTVCNAGCHRQPTIVFEHNFYGTQGSLYYGFDWDTVRDRSHFELVRPEEGRENIDLTQDSDIDAREHFLDCLTNKTRPLVTSLDARNALAVVEAAYESMRTGRKVEINWRSPDN